MPSAGLHHAAARTTMGGLPLSHVWATMPPRSQPKHTEH